MNFEFLKSDLLDALDTLGKGGLILYPTDTVWGIGCDATNPEAVKKIYDLKKRADSKSMIVLTGSEVALEKIVEDIPEIAWELIEVTEKPLTIIYDHPVNVADNLKAPDGSLGVRITREEFSKELCKRFGKPIVSTSANISGDKTPVNFKEISDAIVNGVDYVVKYRQDDLEPRSASSVIKLSAGGVVKVLR